MRFALCSLPFFVCVDLRVMTLCGRARIRPLFAEDIGYRGLEISGGRC